MKKKLDLEKAREIRHKRWLEAYLGRPVTKLAEEYGVSERTIQRILQHRIWIDVEELKGKYFLMRYCSNFYEGENTWMCELTESQRRRLKREQGLVAQ